MGTCTFTPDKSKGERFGNSAVVRGVVNPSASYATGGDTFSVTALTGLKSVARVFIQHHDLTNYYVYDKTNGKLVGYARATDTELTAATDNSGDDIDAIFYGEW